jgi:spore maturation protein CgeB
MFGRIGDLLLFRGSNSSRSLGSSTARKLPARIEDMRVVHIGGYWRGPNDVVRQMLLGLRQTGAEVLEVCTDEHPGMLETEAQPYDRGTSHPVWIKRDYLARLIGHFQPDVIICNAGGLGFHAADAKELRERSYIVGIALSDPDVFLPATSKVSQTCDLFFTNAPQCIADYEQLGVRAKPLHFGTYEGFYRPVPPKPEYRCDVLVFGSGYPHRVEAVRELVRLFETHVYGDLWEQYGIPSRGFVFGEESLSVLSSAKLTVVFGRTSGGNFIVKPYLFDYPAAGATVITEYVPEVEKYFVYEKELGGFSGTADLVTKVRHLLSHPEAAAAMRRAARDRVLREYTWKQRWPEMLESLRSR